MKTCFFASSIFLLLTFNGLNLYSQFNFTGQYMNRAELRNGYNTLLNKGDKPAFFISQRARLASSYKAEKFNIGVSIQDVRTWGSASNSAVDVSGLLSVHEAFAEYFFSKKLSMKMGRQEIDYDEGRIFGSADWAMQARRHDAAILKFKDSTSMFDIGFAFNQNREKITGTFYDLPGNYKTFQYLYYKKNISKAADLSFLFLNNGLQYNYGTPPGSLFRTNYTQTFGTRYVYTGNKLSGNLAAYLQTGKDGADKSVTAFDILGELKFTLNKEWSMTTGGEILSGTSQFNTAKNRSFNPLYGTLHRFNGYMDYFYVGGQHINNVGLIDIYLKWLYKRNKSFVSFNVHQFFAHNDIRDPMNPNLKMKKTLGTEIDLTYSLNLSKNAALQVGYSQIFGTKSLQTLRGGSTDRLQNWVYTMLILRPGAAPWPRTGLKL